MSDEPNEIDSTFSDAQAMAIGRIIQETGPCNAQIGRLHDVREGTIVMYVKLTPEGRVRVYQVTQDGGVTEHYG